MAILNFPPNPFDGQIYPDPPIKGVNVYQYSIAYNTWQLLGKASGVSPGVYGDNVTCVQIGIDAAGIITGIINQPIPLTNEGQIGLAQPGVGLGVFTAGVLDLQPPSPSRGQIGGVKQGQNVTISGDGTISVASSSTTQPGVVQLNNTLSSTSTTQALTAAQGAILQQQISSIATSSIVFCGTFNAFTSRLDFVTSEGEQRGFVLGQNLPTPTPQLNGSFVIVSRAGTPAPPAPVEPIGAGDWVIADVNPDRWITVPIGKSVTASQVIFNPYLNIGATDVQGAIQEVADEINGISINTGVGLTGGPINLTGTISLRPPVGGNIGGVKPGNNVTITADGTISANSSSLQPLDDISGAFNGVSTTFPLTSNGVPIPLTTTVDLLLLSVGGVVQSPTSYSLIGSNVEFTEAPQAGASFSGRVFTSLSIGQGIVNSISGAAPITITGSPTTPIIGVNVATFANAGVVKPDNTSIVVSDTGEISVNPAAQVYHYANLDDISPLFNGGTLQFILSIDGVPYAPNPSSNIMVFVGGVAQVPSSYNIAGNIITFTEPPVPGASFYANTVISS